MGHNNSSYTFNPFICRLYSITFSISTSWCSTVHICYLILKQKLIKASMRNDLQDNAVVTWFKNHRIQLDNVDMVQYV